MAFRARKSNESLTSYLKAKRDFEMSQTGSSTVDLGNQPKPTSQSSPSLSESGRYYKKGNDVFETGTNRHIILDEFKRLNLNFSLLPDSESEAKKLLDKFNIDEPTSKSKEEPTAGGEPSGGESKYITYAGSPDIFNKSTGEWISQKRAKELGLFTDRQGELNTDKVEASDETRPDLTSVDDFQKLAQTDINMGEAPVTTDEGILTDEAPVTTDEGILTDEAPAEVSFAETQAYKNLSADEKALVNMSYNALMLDDETQATAFSDAISQAKKIADPYFKSLFTLAEGEYESKRAELEDNFERKAEVIERTRRELMEDVKNRRGDLTVEHQAELAKQAREYQNDLLDIADQAAERGITFATGRVSRAATEDKRTTRYKDVVESETRQFNRRIRDLQLKADRGDTEAQKQLEELRAKRGFDVGKIGRAAEEVLGTERFKETTAAEGVKPTGTEETPIVGELESQKERAVLRDTATFFNQNQGIL